jgi:hypothetical protein
MSPYQQGWVRRRKVKKENSYAGVDISKENLDVAVNGSDRNWRFGNSPAGIKKAIEVFKEMSPRAGSI